MMITIDYVQDYAAHGVLEALKRSTKDVFTLFELRRYARTGIDYWLNIERCRFSQEGGVLRKTNEGNTEEDTICKSSSEDEGTVKNHSSEGTSGATDEYAYGYVDETSDSSEHNVNTDVTSGAEGDCDSISRDTTVVRYRIRRKFLRGRESNTKVNTYCTMYVHISHWQRLGRIPKYIHPSHLVIWYSNKMPCFQTHEL